MVCLYSMSIIALAISPVVFVLIMVPELINYLWFGNEDV